MWLVKEYLLKFMKFWLGHKKILLSALFAVFVLLVSIAIEASFTDFKLVQSKVSLFDTYSQSKGLQVRYDFNQQFSSFDINNNKAPKFLKTNDKSTTLKFLNSAYLSMAPMTELRTLVFTKNKYHAELQSGTIVLNNLTEKNPITIQVSNILIQPNLNSVSLISYLDGNLIVEVLSGNSIVAVYDEQGTQVRKLNLANSNRISAFDSFAVEGDIIIEKPIDPNPYYLELVESKLMPSATEQIAVSEVFNLTYKGRNVTPKNKSIFTNLSASLSFNQNLKNYNSMYPFFAEINQLVPGAVNLDSKQVNKLIQTYLELSKENPDAVKPFKEIIEQKGLFILALSPESSLYPLKEKFTSIFELGTNFQIVAANLEDLYLLYIDDNYLAIDKVLTELEPLIPKLSNSEAKNALVIVDNILEITPKANTEELFQFRNLFLEKLNSPLDRTVYRIKTIQHLERLKSLADTNSITNSQIKRSVEILVKTLDLQSQTEYQEFLNNLE
jgi:hypothetical protein